MRRDHCGCSRLRWPRLGCSAGRDRSGCWSACPPTAAPPSCWGGSQRLAAAVSRPAPVRGSQAGSPQMARRRAPRPIVAARGRRRRPTRSAVCVADAPAGPAHVRPSSRSGRSHSAPALDEFVGPDQEGSTPPRPDHPTWEAARRRWSSSVTATCSQAAPVGQNVARRHRRRRDGRVTMQVTLLGPLLERPAAAWRHPPPSWAASDVLFIDEVHRLSRSIEGGSTRPVEDFRSYHVLGRGPQPSIRLDLPASAGQGPAPPRLITGPLRDRSAWWPGSTTTSPTTCAHRRARPASSAPTSMGASAEEIAGRSRGARSPTDFTAPGARRGRGGGRRPHRRGDGRRPRDVRHRLHGPRQGRPVDPHLAVRPLRRRTRSACRPWPSRWPTSQRRSKTSTSHADPTGPAHPARPGDGSPPRRRGSTLGWCRHRRRCLERWTRSLFRTDRPGSGRRTNPRGSLGRHI